MDADRALRARFRTLLTQRPPGERVEVRAYADAEKALAHVRRRGVDVVVVGAPEGARDGASLLRAVQREAPQVVRVVLSDEDPCSVFRRVPYAHQFFARDAGELDLRSRLIDCFELRAIISRVAVRSLVASHNRLPATPALYTQLIDLLSDPRSSMVKVAEVIERDAGMSGRLMQVVSSAFFGLPSQMTSMGACVAYLGLDTIRSLVLSAEISRAFPVRIRGFSAESLQAQALAVSRLTRRMAGSMAEPSQAFVAGLLHNIGRLVLASRAPEGFAEAIELSQSSSLTLAEAETQVFGVTNAEVGAYLLGIWGQPSSVVRAIAAQDYPAAVDADAPGLATVLHLGKRLAVNPAAQLSQQDDPGDSISETHLHRVGALEQLAEWRTLAQRLAS